MQILGAQCANETDWVEEKQKKTFFPLARVINKANNRRSD